VMREADWRFAVCSPENVPVELHVGKLVEKFTGKPLLPGAHERVPPVQLADAVAWLEPRVFFLLPNEGWTVSDVLQRATALVRQQGIQGLVIDPWNEFEHVRTGGLSETEYVSTTMSEIRRWARLHSAHVWVVAHPQKLYRKDDGSYPVPTPYDISGSAHFRNKADCCLTVWRDEAAEATTTSIYVQKIRFRWIGGIGKIELEWDRVTGRYRDATEALAR
jgi:twinkle protein